MIQIWNRFNATEKLCIYGLEPGAHKYQYVAIFSTNYYPHAFFFFFFFFFFFEAMGILLPPPSVRPSICLSACYLLLNHWEEFYHTCYITYLYGKGVREQYYFSVHRSVHLSIALSPPKPLCGPTKIATSLPLMVRLCESKILFPYVHPSVCPYNPSISLSRYLLLSH